MISHAGVIVIIKEAVMSSLYSTQRNNIMVCRCFSIDPADSKYCQNQFINTFRAKYPDLMVPLEGEGGGGVQRDVLLGCFSTNCLVFT